MRSTEFGPNFPSEKFHGTEASLRDREVRCRIWQKERRVTFAREWSACRLKVTLRAQYFQSEIDPLDDLVIRGWVRAGMVRRRRGGVYRRACDL